MKLKSTILVTTLLTTTFSYAKEDKKLLSCVENLLANKRVSSQTLESTAKLIDKVVVNQDENLLEECQKLTNSTEHLTLKKFDTYQEIVSKLNNVSENQKDFLMKMAFPSLDCTIRGAHLEAGIGGGMGVGMYRGKCVDELNRKVKVTVPSVSLSGSIGAALYFEKVNIQYVSGKDLMIPAEQDDMVYGTFLIGKKCVKGCSNPGFGIGMFAGVVGQAFIPVQAKVPKLDRNFLKQNW